LVIFFALSALRIPAGVALTAAFLVDDGGDTAFGAEVADLLDSGRRVGGGGFGRRGEVGDVVDQVLLHSAGLIRGLAQADGALIQVFLEHLGDAIGQGAHAVGAKAQRATAADAQKLTGEVGEALRRFNG